MKQSKKFDVEKMGKYRGRMFQLHHRIYMLGLTLDLICTIILLKGDDNMEENPCKGLIELGKIYSYKDLCEAVNDKYYSGGKSKQYQLRKWSRYFKWEYEINARGKQTKKMIVTEVYDEPLPEEDGRRCEYDLSDILLMLINGYNCLHYDEKEDLYSMGVTKTKINELVGLCNEQYVKTMNTPIAGIPKPTHRDFFASTNSSFDSIIKSNLNSLQKKNVLVYSDGQLWYEMYLDENGKTKRTYKLASDKEHAIIRKARYLTLQEWNKENGTNLTTYGEVFHRLTPFEQQAFEHQVKTIIRQNKGMERYEGSYACHKITFSKLVIQRELEKRKLTDEEQHILMQTLRKEINGQMVTKVLTSSKSRYEKAIEKSGQQKAITTRETGFGKSAVPLSKAMQDRLSDDDYIRHCEEITAVVIPLSTQE